MTDREMLEFAAKAVAIKGEYGYAPDDYYYDGNVEGILTYLPNGQMHVWNPLTDDGDLFLLQVMLRLELEFGTDFVSVGRSYGNNGEWHLATEFGSDLRATTRLAIFRAAVEIGRNIG